MWQKNFAKDKHVAFTLAEVLITLAVIGIVAVLTIPALVKNHQEKAWATAQNVFTKKFEVALKTMANNSTVSGYDSTESFVNELKKYIKITNVCTDDVTKCFAPKVVWAKDTEAIEVTNKAVKYNESTGDWAETVGVQFANSVNALISYNKQCYVDTYNNQEAITAKCVGMIYDVSGFKTPNTNGKDIIANANVASLKDLSGCVYVMNDGTCITKILGPLNGGYSPLSYKDCEEKKTNKEIDVDYCNKSSDYYAGAVLACGGKKANLPTETQLTLLAQEVYNDTSITSSDKSNLTQDTEKAAPFLTQSPYGNASSHPRLFSAWASQEDSANYAYRREFRITSTKYTQLTRDNFYNLAVCVGNEK